MPLFLKKHFYVKNDVVVTTTINHCDLYITLGFCDRSSSSLKSLDIRPVWELWHSRRVANPFFYNRFESSSTLDLGADPYGDGTSYIHGAVFGELDISDIDECRSFLSLCAQKIIPQYIDYLHWKALTSV